VNEIAAALNLRLPSRHLEPRIRFRIEAAVERGADNITIDLGLARQICSALAIAQGAAPAGGEG
jgi:uncharacterized protein YicC (UPF0701 family)